MRLAGKLRRPDAVIGPARGSLIFLLTDLGQRRRRRVLDDRLVARVSAGCVNRCVRPPLGRVTELSEQHDPRRQPGAFQKGGCQLVEKGAEAGRVQGEVVPNLVEL